MADVNLSGLDDIYGSKDEAAPAPKSSGLDLSGLDSIYTKPSKPSLISQLMPSGESLNDAAIGAADTLGVSQQVGGEAQAMPDAIQSVIHNMIPSLVGKSPTQVNAALKSLGIKGDIGPTSSDELYKQGTKDVLKDQDEAVKRSPIAYRAGEAGGIGLGALATGGIAPELMTASKGAGLLAKAGVGAVNAAPVGALYGALNSHGSIVGGTPDEMKQVGKDAALGAGIGATVGAGAAAAGHQISKSLAKLGDHPAFKELAERYKIGTEGKNISNEADMFGTSAAPESFDTALSQHDSRSANELLEGLNKMDDSLGENVGKSLAEATEKGVNIKATQPVSQKLDKLMGALPDISIGDEGLNVGDSGEYAEPAFKSLSEMANKFKNEGLNPSELWKFRNELANAGKTLRNSSNANDRLLANEIYSTTSDLSGTLKQSVPDYGDAASRMESFRRNMPESILSKDNPADVTGLRVSGTRNVDQKLMQNLKKMVRGIYNDDDIAKGSFTNLLKGMQDLNQSEMALKESGKITQTIFEEMGVQPQQIEDFIKQQAMRSKTLQNYAPGGLSLGHGVVDSVKATVKNSAGDIAEKMGNRAAAKNPTVSMSQKLFSAPDDTLNKFSSDVLSKIPGQKPLADALANAINNKDSTAKNAVLFTIMQNPNLRSLVESNNLEF